MKKKLVVIGNGMAPGRVLERLLEIDPDAFEITIFNAEKRVNYDRIMLSPVLSGEKKFEEIVIHGDAWYEHHGIALIKGRKIIDIDRSTKRVTAEGGMTAGYDKLLIATGSVPFIIPVPGNDLPGVLTYRDIDDVTAMMVAADQGKKNAVVIGGGLLGLEAAAGLKAQGMNATVIHLMDTLMERQLDPTAGGLLQHELERRGIRVLTNANTKQVIGKDQVEAVLLNDGTTIPADLVIMAAGIRPSADLAEKAGLKVGRGIMVDRKLHTSDPDIMAVGECVEFEGNVYGLVAPLYEMACIVADELLGIETTGFTDKALATKLKVTGIDLYSAGDFAQGEGRQDITVGDTDGNLYKRIIIKDDKIIGAVMYGDTADGPWFFHHIKNETNIATMRDTLIFGPAFEDDTQVAPPPVAPMKPTGEQIRQPVEA